MEKKIILDEISTLIDIECARNKTNKSKLSKELGKNDRYLNNMFNKNDSFDISIICEIAVLLDCEPSILIPNLDFLKSLDKKL
jgi:hypothetical protein